MLRNSCRKGGYARQSVSSSPPMTTAVRTAWDALRQGLSACRQYERLMSMGISHDAALRQALGVPHGGPELVPGTPQPVGHSSCIDHGTAGFTGSACIGNLAYVT